MFFLIFFFFEIRGQFYHLNPNPDPATQMKTVPFRIRLRIPPHETLVKFQPKFVLFLPVLTLEKALKAQDSEFLILILISARYHIIHFVLGILTNGTPT
jgi:hypothetical protein